jgi:RNA polymerase sigma factor (sigma-70 family)
MRTSATVGEVRAYLFAAARTVLAAHWRRTLGREVTTLDLERLADVLTGAPSNAAAVGRAEALLDRLPPRYRQILRLRFLQGCSVRDAAAELGISVGNAKVLQYRALRHAAAVGETMEHPDGPGDGDEAAT